MTAIHTESYCWDIDERGRSAAFLDTRTGVDGLARPGEPIAILRRGKETIAPCEAAVRGGDLHIAFEDGTRAVMRVENFAAYAVLTVADVSATDFDRLDFVDVPLKLDPVGDPDAFCACAISRNLLTRVDAVPGPQQRLTAACYPRFGIEGASVALAAARFCELRTVLQHVVSSAPDLPHSPLGGPWALDPAENRNSYLFGVATEETVDEWIALCQDFGIGQLHFCGGGAVSLGDYDPNPALYPDGIGSLKTVVDRIHGAGLQAGLHTLSFSIAKGSRYITPVPDPRLGCDNMFTLAEDMDASSGVVPVLEPTEHMPRFVNYQIRKSMTLMLDQELIEYGSVQSTEPFALTQCRRGAYGTSPTAHRAGTRIGNLKACWSMFAPDGDSTLFTEIAANIANLINGAGFDMVYLDGLDGAHILGNGDEGRWHYGGRFAFEVYNRLDRPIIMEMAAFLHHLWFMRSRMGAWDTASRGHKAFIDMHCRSNANFAKIFLPGHLGWWSPRVSTGCKDETTFPEDVAYLCTKAIADNIGFSLQGMSPAALRSTPYFGELAEVVRRHEVARRSPAITDDVRAALGRKGAEFILDDSDAHTPAFHAMARHVQHTALPGCGGPRWTISSNLPAQTPRLRLEALWSAADYDSNEALTLGAFVEPDEFADNAPVRIPLNSGEDYTYPAAAPGMDIRLQFGPGAGPDGGPAAILSATRKPTEERVMSSAPDDDFSVLHHGERFHRPRKASWARVGKSFDTLMDLSTCQALGLWVHGDGKGEWLNVQVRSLGQYCSFSDHYVPIDFSGWRYIELIEPESERFDCLSWPYARAVYKLHRHGVEYGCVSALHLWLNNVPENESVGIKLSPVRALSVVSNRLLEPTLTVNGTTLSLPVDLESGCRVEVQEDRGQVLNARGGMLKEFRLPEPIPQLRTGENDLSFCCESSLPRPRARITLMAQDPEPLRS